MNANREAEIAVITKRLENSGKPVKIMGTVTKLPLCKEAMEHFAQHKEEYVWRAEPIKGVRQDVDGLYVAIWLTDKYDHIPVLYASEEVMRYILGLVVSNKKDQ